MSETYQFDVSFERKLLAFLVRNIKFYHRNSGYVREVYFQNQFHKDIWKAAKNYIEVYNNPIAETDLRNEITKMYYDRLKRNVDTDEYFDVIAEIFKIDLTTSEEYTEEEIRKFARNREMESALNKGLEMVDRSKDLMPLLNDITKALSVGQKLNTGYDYFGMAEERFARGIDAEKIKVSTGIRKLDRYLRGGLAQGELGIVAAPWNRGKTALLVNFSYGALKRFKNVAYINLEGKIDDVATRFDILINQVDKDTLLKEQLRVEEIEEQNKYFTFISHVDKMLKSKLILRGFPADTVTVADIEQYILHEQLLSEVKFDLIVIDYLNKCKRSNPRDESWMGQSYREGQSLAGKLDVPLWSAAQVKADEVLRYKLLTPNHIAESTNRIASDTDVIVHILCEQKEESKETDPVRMKLYLGKNRNNPGRREIPIDFYRSKMLIEEVIITEVPQTPPQPSNG